MLKYFKQGIWLCLVIILPSFIWAQGKPYDGPDDPAGDPAAERYGWMTGNNVLLFFRNTTELSDCCQLGYDVSKWPNNYEGTKMTDGIMILVGARVYVRQDSFPVEDPASYTGDEPLDTLYFVEASYREFMDKNPAGTVEWALYPPFGYFNPLDEYPAMSNLPNSWPPEGWPTKDGTKWPGEWNGRFGRGIMKADQEIFVVVNDAQDQEWLPTNPNNKKAYYYPRRVYGPNGEILKDVRIGDKRPEVTVQKGFPWGGIGIRIEQRGFQWSNPAAADAIFFEYNVANISEYDLPEVFFGYEMDNAVGGGEGFGDDIAYYNKDLNMAYTWDADGVPDIGGGREPGVYGFAYLESPGIAYDGIDNDNDGLIDEKRDNQATMIVGPTDGIADLYAFLKYYNLQESDLREHWDADEDQDWQDGLDLNGNGTYTYFDSTAMVWRVEPGEYVGDDVGLDGVGPFDLNYNGPDEGECNHKPDFVEGIGCEPNFAATDVTESDMLGLTSFRYLLDWIPGLGGPGTPQDDKSLFLRLTQGIFDDAQMNPQNFIEQFASGLFPLYKGRTERISMANLYAYDPLTGLNSAEHKAPALFRLKEVVQQIYESDYRFAQPPLMPTLTATPMDGKVVLSWDDKADQYTREPFLDNRNDFEGYKLYRATDKLMSDPMVITDGYGTNIFRKPIFQCDLVDNRTGFTNYGLLNGAGYYLGDDSGIQHYFVDNTVTNGMTYYYVLVAYDYGIDSIGAGIPPSENTFVIELDEYENIRRITKNVQIVQPHQFAAGYTPPNVQKEEQKTFGTGNVEPELLIPQFIKSGHEYYVVFDVDTIDFLNKVPFGLIYRNTGIRIYDATEGNKLIYYENKNKYTANNFVYYQYDFFNSKEENWLLNYGKDLSTGQFDGLLVHFKVPVETAQPDWVNSGWVQGSAPIKITMPAVVIKEGQQKGYRPIMLPYDYDIIFTDVDTAYVSKFDKNRFWAEDRKVIYTKKDYIPGQAFSFYVVNRSVQDENGDDVIMEMIAHDLNGNGQFDILEDQIVVGVTNSIGFLGKGKWAATAFVIDFHNCQDVSQLPKPGDVYHITFQRPFAQTDTIRFVVNAPDPVDPKKLDEEMDKIRVVPNPYVATNRFETNVANFQLSQRRRIMFTHLPAQCTIKIFTVSGVLVDVIEVNNSVGNRSSEWDLNSEANGTAFWDLKSKEGLDVAAGYYIYHVKSHLTGKEVMGKFAILK